jgi:hypothetical protein
MTTLDLTTPTIVAVQEAVRHLAPDATVNVSAHALLTADAVECRLTGWQNGRERHAEFLVAESDLSRPGNIEALTTNALLALETAAA